MSQTHCRKRFTTGLQKTGFKKPNLMHFGGFWVSWGFLGQSLVLQKT